MAKEHSPLEYIGIGFSVIGLLITIVQYVNRDKPTLPKHSKLVAVTEEDKHRINNPTEDASYVLNEDTLNWPLKSNTVENLISKEQQQKLQQEFNDSVIIVLKSNTQYKGPKAWETMRSLGLNHHPKDQLFHWDSKNLEHSYFVVSTSTYPRHFKIDPILDGRTNPQDLIFSFHMPLVPEPEKVYGCMYRGVKYCQEKLGGDIVTKNGEPLNFKKSLKELKGRVETLKSNKIEPGSVKAQQIFG